MNKFLIVSSAALFDAGSLRPAVLTALYAIKSSQSSRLAVLLLPEDKGVWGHLSEIFKGEGLEPEVLVEFSEIPSTAMKLTGWFGEADRKQVSYLTWQNNPTWIVRERNLADLLGLRIFEGSSWRSLQQQIIFPGRSAEVVRETKETKIKIQIDLDNSTAPTIKTGIGFFDHMLEQIAKHAGITLNVICDGDLQIDEHHSIEDTGIAIGTALLQALGDKRGIERYGFVVPMDEAQASVTLDFSGRYAFDWKVAFTREKIGEMPAEMFKHFFGSLAEAARMNLHIEARGENEHHIIEGVFKAFARALKQAISRSSGSTDLPSTKGIL